MAIPFNIDQLKARLATGGARNNLFSVQISAPAIVGLPANATFLINAAKLPEVDMGVIEVPFMGRKLRVPGDRTFPAWSVSVINDEDFTIRQAMEKWTNLINGLSTNLRDSNFASLASLKCDATVTQYSKTGADLRTYKFAGMFPQSISAIDLDWAQNDQIEFFNVTFVYDYWTVTPAGTATTNGGVAQQVLQ